MVNYIVLGHKNPVQIKRLIEKLQVNEVFFYVYVHIDSNTEIDQVKAELSGFSNLLFLEKERRYPGIWGDMGIVMATVEVLKQILKDGRSGYCILLSGQDYPIKDKEYIKTFFQRNYGINYINVFPLPAKFWENSNERISYYKINKSEKRGDYVLLPSIFEKEFYTLRTSHSLKQLLLTKKFFPILRLFKKRRFPRYIKAYGGDQWWALPIETVEKIIDFIDNYPGYFQYHKYSLLPDEMFFQSIFMWLNRDKVLYPYQPSLTYVNWNRNNISLPVTFTRHDFEELSSLPDNKLFARKFDIETDQEILNLLDKQMVGEPV